MTERPRAAKPRATKKAKPRANAAAPEKPPATKARQGPAAARPAPAAGVVLPGKPPTTTAKIDPDKLLPLRGTTVTLDAALFAGTALADQLERLTNGAPIVIQDAKRTAAGPTVVVKGKTSFLRVPNVPVAVTATVGTTGLTLLARFTLVSGQPGPHAWTFTKSFPDLPPFAFGAAADKGGGPGAPAAVPHLLDRLPLADAAFVLATDAAQDAATSAPVSPGLNFVAKCQPAALLGLFGSVVGGVGWMPIYGLVRLPKAAERTTPLPPLAALQKPWQLSKPVPGILLRIDSGSTRVLGKLQLSDVGLRLYVPPSQAWAAENPTYPPAFAGAAKLTVPSAKLSLDLTVPALLAREQVTFFGRFQGVGVAKLAQLADLAGADDLASVLPDDVKAGLASLKSLSLDALALTVSKDLSVAGVALTLSLPGLSTEVLPGFTVSSLRATLDVEAPFRKERALTATLGGRLSFAGAPFDVDVRLPDVAAQARLAAGTALPLAKLLGSVGLPAAPDLSVDELDLSVDGDGSLRCAAAFASAPPWTLDLGPTALTLRDLRLVAARPKAGPPSGAFSGTVDLAGASLAFALQTPGDFVLRGALPDVTLGALLGALTSPSLELPPGFDLAFDDTAVLVQKRGASLCLQLATVVPGVGTLALEVRRVGPQWGGAFGVDLVTPKLSKLPGLGALSVFEALFHLDQLVLVVSSFDDPGFQFPGLAAFDAPALGGGKLALPASGGVIAGFNASARWSLDASREQQLLQRLLGLSPTVGVTLQIGKDPSKDARLYASLQTHLLGQLFTCQFGGQLQGGQLGLFLTGKLSTSIQGQGVQFDVTLLFVPNGALLSGSMLGSVHFYGVTLSNLALVVGMDWEGIPSLGVAATIAIDRFQSSVAVFFDSTDPARSMVAGAVSEINLREVVDAFAGNVLPSSVDAVLETIALVGVGELLLPPSVAAALDARDVAAVSQAFSTAERALPAVASQVLLVVSQPGETWFLTDMSTMEHWQLRKQADGVRAVLQPQLSIVPATTHIGALRFEQGIRLAAGLTFLSFHASADVVVRPSQGVLVDAHMDRIVLGSERFFCLEGAKGGGPRVSICSFSRPDQADPTLRAPHLLLDAKLSLLGLSRQVYVRIDAKGLDFELQGALLPGATYSLHGSFHGLDDLAVGGSMSFGIGKIDLGPLGSVDVATGVTGSLDLGLSSGKLWAKFAGGFQVAGVGFTLPAVSLDVAVGSLLDLPKRLFDLVVAALKDFFLDPLKWAKWVADQIVAGVLEVAKVLRDVFGKATAEAAAAVMRAAGFVASEVAKGISSAYATVAGQAAVVLRGVGYAATEVAGALQSAYGTAAAQAVALLRGAGYALGEVAGALKGAFGKTTAEVASLLRGAGVAAAEVAGALKGAFGTAADEAAKALRVAGYAAAEVAGALKGAFGRAAADVAALLRGAGCAAAEVGSALQSAYGTAADEAAKVLRGVGYAAGEVGDALKSAYGVAGDQAAKLLKGAGYAAAEVGGALKSAYGFTGDQVATALRGAGYAAGEVAGALKTAYGFTADQVAVAMKGAGYAVNEVGDALKSAYGATADGVGKALKGAGWAVDQVGGFLKDAYGLGPQALKSTLEGLGYAGGQIEGFFKGLGGDFAGFFGDVGDALDPTNW